MVGTTELHAWQTLEGVGWAPPGTRIDENTKETAPAREGRLICTGDTKHRVLR